jgi:hypothetical protein
MNVPELWFLVALERWEILQWMGEDRENNEEKCYKRIQVKITIGLSVYGSVP